MSASVRYWREREEEGERETEKGTERERREERGGGGREIDREKDVRPFQLG